MKNIRVFITAIVLLASVHFTSAIEGLTLSIQSSNVVLTWPSVEGEMYIVEHRSTLDTNTTWEILTNYVPAAVGTNKTSFVHSNQVTPHENFSDSGSETSDAKYKKWEDKEPALPPLPWDQTTWPTTTSFSVNGPGPDNCCGVEMGFYLVIGYGEDTDGDGFDNLTELVLGSDPLVREGDATSLTNGGVYSGEVNITFTPSSNYTNILGPMLYADGVLANSLITTEPSSGNLRLQWHSVFVHTASSSSLMTTEGPGPTPPTVNFTKEESDLLADAFGPGTKTAENIISKPNQAKVDLLPRELLERYEQFAAASVKETFQLIQKANKGTYVPAGGLENFMRARIAFVHTQFTRMQVITSSLSRRFGRAVNRVLPFLGGIIILANADNISANFLSAMNAYARDIARGEDETGDAAILAGYCNDLAPGSGNIVLNYLLR